MAFPIHTEKSTEHPEAYRKVSKNMRIVEEGKKYSI